MRVAVTGGTGLVGRFVVLGLAAEGHEVTVLSRRAPAAGELPAGVAHVAFDLAAAAPPPLAGFDALVHAAFDHVPGRYRGGEGEDPAGFLSRNLGATVSLFDAAREAGLGRAVFLSSRAVYGDYPPGTDLTEELPPRPDTLYGHVKREAEAALSRLSGPGFAGVSLRITGVYGPGSTPREHKWAGLFDAFAHGEAVEPRAGTEVHGGDVASAVALCLSGALPHEVCNVSDVVVDRADLLAEFGRITGARGRLPERVDPGRVSAMRTDRIRAAGWSPRGRAGLTRALEEMCRPWMRS